MNSGKESAKEEMATLSPTSISRRTFLAWTAACTVAGPDLLRAATSKERVRTILHVATRTPQSAYLNTFALTSAECVLLGSTAIDSFRAFAIHPALPIIYVARDCSHWENLPRGVIESYAVERSRQPLRLLAQTPMALSATGPRSLAVSICGKHLMVAASTGGAWNAFDLDHDGIPAPVAIARKETGIVSSSHVLSLPTPHTLAFSPRAPLAVGIDPGSQRMSVLQPLPEEIAVVARCQPPQGLAPLAPVWTFDARYIIAVDARTASLSIYEVRLPFGNGSEATIRRLGAFPTITPLISLLSHPAESAVFTSRPLGAGSSLEVWSAQNSSLRWKSSSWISGKVVALAHDGSALWVASQDRLIKFPMDDLRHPVSTRMLPPAHQAQAIVTQSLT